MNDHVNTAALSEIDRLGQKVLDAIWAEESLYNGNRTAVTKLLHENPEMDPQESLRQMGELLGTDGMQETMKRSIEIWQRGADRDAAINEYLTARRLLASVL